MHGPRGHGLRASVHMGGCGETQPRLWHTQEQKEPSKPAGWPWPARRAHLRTATRMGKALLYLAANRHSSLPTRSWTRPTRAPSGPCPSLRMHHTQQGRGHRDKHHGRQAQKCNCLMSTWRQWNHELCEVTELLRTRLLLKVQENEFRVQANHQKDPSGI